MYRTKKELQQEASRDILTIYPSLLLKGGILTEKEQKKLYDEVDREIKEALNKALATESPMPQESLDHLFSMSTDITSQAFEKEAEFSGKDDIPMAQAINNVLKDEFGKNPLLRMFGEDVADFTEKKKLDDTTLKGKGGVFKVSAGVQRTSLDGQVFNAPLAEANIVGRGDWTGPSRGIKPVVEIQFFDYIWTAYMQLKNEMATTRYRSGG